MFFAVAVTSGLAAEFQPFPGLSEKRGLEIAQVPELDLFSDFRTRMQAALERRNSSGIASLYETNGVTAGELKTEMDRWQRITGENSKSVSVFFKDLNRLPSESFKYWSTEAHRLTKHEVTHFAIVRSGGGTGLILPLVLVDNTLLVVPSEKSVAKTAGPAGAFVYPDEDQPIVKLTLAVDGTYMSEDFTQPDYWIMMEGTKSYFEPLKPHPQKGQWSWNPGTGELRLAAVTSEPFIFNLERLRFETRDPDRLRWGEFARAFNKRMGLKVRIFLPLKTTSETCSKSRPVSPVTE